MKQIFEAKAYSKQGGQALHVHNFNIGHPMFRRYPQIAHLFDANKTRLIATARRLGVRDIKVEREGEEGQHIDLCGKPFERACQECNLTPAEPDICPRCEGTKVYQRLGFPPQPCSLCNGTGKTPVS